MEHVENVKRLAKLIFCGPGTIIWLSDTGQEIPSPTPLIFINSYYF